MIQWFSENLWAIWLILAVVLGIAEMLVIDFTMLMLACGSLIGMLVALFTPSDLWPLQIVSAVFAAVLLLVLLRPTLLKKVRSNPGYSRPFDEMFTIHGIATSDITALEGTVLLNSDTWSARCTSGTIKSGTSVKVERKDGILLYVTPVLEEQPK